MKHAVHNKQGFTLIELLVGVVIFILTITAALNLLMSGLRSQRKSIAIQNVQEHVRYLLGFMSKEIRMSEIITDDGEFPSLNIMVFNSTLGEYISIRYSFSGNQILRIDTDPETVDGPISSDEVQVQGKFYVDGKTLNDYQQPRVTIIMKVSAVGTKVEEQATMNLQTTLSQRILY